METQYIKKDNGHTYYYADEDMTILHRLDGPAVEGADGYKAWWVKNKLHRLDGPAVEHADGSKSWHVDDILHRLDGPAKEYVCGYKAWFVDGRRLTEAEFNMRHQLKEITLEQIAKKFGIELSKLRIKPN